MSKIKVQEINTPKGIRYIVLDSEYKVIEPIKRYLKFLDNVGKSPNTIKNYAFHLKTYCEYLKEINIGLYDINTVEGKGPLEILSDYIVWLQYPELFRCNVISIVPIEEKRGNKTVNLMINTVLGFYDYLAKNNELPEVDVYKLQRNNSQFKSFLYELINNKQKIKKSLLKKKVTDKPLEYITREQYNKIFQLCYSIRDKIIVSLMFEGGLRLSEVLGLHIEDIEIWNSKVNIVPRENLENGARVKNQAKGSIFMPDYVMDLLLEYITKDLEEYDTNFLFVNLNGKNKGKPMKAITVQKLFERFSKSLNLSLHPHLCRHGYATERLEAGWELIDIMDTLRHKQLNSTSVYTHFAEQFKKDKVREFYEIRNLKFGGYNNE